MNWSSLRNNWLKFKASGRLESREYTNINKERSNDVNMSSLGLWKHEDIHYINWLFLKISPAGHWCHNWTSGFWALQKPYGKVEQPKSLFTGIVLQLENQLWFRLFDDIVNIMFSLLNEILSEMYLDIGKCCEQIYYSLLYHWQLNIVHSWHTFLYIELTISSKILNCISKYVHLYTEYTLI